MSQAITTKRTGSGDFIARAACGSVRFSRDFALNDEGNHKAACAKLVRKMKWFYGEWIGGCDYAGNYVWTCNHAKNPDATERLTLKELQNEV